MLNSLLAGAAFASVFTSASLALAQQEPQYYGHHMWEGGWSGWFFGPLMMILVLVVAVILIVLLVRWLGGPGHGAGHGTLGQPGKAPLDILKERYARGEIDKDEFEERRRTLES
jgi:putative membrane protein